MQPEKDAMKVALRVLTALGDHREPYQADIAELRRIAPDKAAASIDELACDVIQRAIRHRAEARSRHMSG
jgi:hypothetical protein